MIRYIATVALSLALAGPAAADPAGLSKADKPASPKRAAVAAGLPDWSGQWQIEGMEPDATGSFLRSIGEVMKDVSSWGPAPYADNVRSTVEKAFAQGTGDGPPGGPMSACAFGFPEIALSSPLMFEVLATPKETALIFSGREIRHVYTDGRKHTSADDIFPTFWGDSIGRWEGQTLVIDTIAVQSPLAPPGMPMIPIVIFGNGGGVPVAILSQQARFVERLSMQGGKLRDEMTITDPVMFAKPWHVSRSYTRVRGVNRMIHEDCSGQDRNPIVNGQFTLAPPASPPPLPPQFKPLVDLLQEAAR